MIGPIQPGPDLRPSSALQATMKGYCPLAKPLVSSQDRLSQERKCLEEKEGYLWDLNASLNQILDQPST